MDTVPEDRERRTPRQDSAHRAEPAVAGDKTLSPDLSRVHATGGNAPESPLAIPASR